jgi:WD40 repeat protein
MCAVPGPGGRTLLATAGLDATVRLWDPATGTQIGEPLTGHTDRVGAMCAVPRPGRRTLLATAGLDATVRLWDPATGTPIRVLQVGIGVNALCASPDGSLAIATSEGVAVLVVRLAAEDVIPHVES